MAKSHKENIDEKDESQEESEVKEELVWDDDEKESESHKESEVKEEEIEEQEEGDGSEKENKEQETEEAEEKEDEEDQDEEEKPTHEEIRKSEILRHDLNKFVRDNQPSYNLTPQSKKPSGKLITLILFILAVLVIGSGIYFITGIGSPGKQEQAQTPTSTPEPTPTPEALNKSEWSIEVLNGSGITGEAKKVADGLKELGYQVTKVGNADKDDYETHQLFVSEDFVDQIDAVVVDIKDIIKIASISGKLKDSTPSARIIIGRE